MKKSTLLFVVCLFSTQFAFGADCAEVGYVATFNVNPGSEAEFEDVIMTLAETVMEVEPGVILYAPYKGAQPGRYYMMERYKDEAARGAHGKSEQVSKLFPALGPLLNGRADVQPVTALCR